MNFLPLSVRYFAGVLNQGVIFSDDAYVYWTLIYIETVQWRSAKVNIDIKIS